MANILELLGIGGRKPANTAESVAAESAAPSGLASGGLSGLLAGSVFGGPVGAAIGLGVGLVTNRMRSAAIDATAEDMVQMDNFARSIRTQTEDAAPYAQKYGDDIDMSELTSIQASAMRYQQLSQHYDPAIREKALEGMEATDTRLAAWKEDLQTRTREIADRDTELRAKVGDRYQTEITGLQTMVREKQTEVDKVLGLLNELGADNPAVQSAARGLVGETFREAASEGIQVSIPFISADLGEHKFTRDEIVKLSTSIAQTSTQRASERLQLLMKSASDDGYAINAKDGNVSVNDLNIVVDTFRRSAPTAVPSGAPAPAATPTDRLKETVTTGAPKLADAAAGAVTTVGETIGRGVAQGQLLIEQGTEFVSEKAKEASATVERLLEANRQRVEKHRGSRRRRTN